MAYTRETLKVYLSLTDDQLRTIGQGNIAKRREVAQAWVEGKTIQVLSPDGWVDINTRSIGLVGNTYRIKPEPMVRVTINGKEYSYYPPTLQAKGQVGYSVYRSMPAGTYAVDTVHGNVRHATYRWRTREEAQQFADILNAMLEAEAKE